MVSPSVLRDISERGRDLESVLAQYITFVKPAFEEFCLPVSIYWVTGSCGCVPERGLMVKSCSLLVDMLQTKKYADVIIPRGADNIGEYLSFYAGRFFVWKQYHCDQMFQSAVSRVLSCRTQLCLMLTLN